MLNKPLYGWSKITVNNKTLGSASYLDWLPGIVLEPCIRYLECAIRDLRRWDHSPGGYGFNITFDGEEVGHFGIVEIGDDFYTYDTLGNKDPYIQLYEIDLKQFGWQGYKFVQSLLSETIDDIEKYFEEWVIWDAFDEEDAKRNRRELAALLKKAKRVLDEIQRFSEAKAQ